MMGIKELVEHRALAVTISLTLNLVAYSHIGSESRGTFITFFSLQVDPITQSDRKLVRTHVYVIFDSM